MLEIFGSLSAADYIRISVEIAVLTFAFYKIFSAIYETRASQLVMILLVTIFVFVVAYIFDLEVILQLYKVFLVPFAMMLIVFYHTELKRAFTSPRTKKSLFRKGTATTSDKIDTVLNACHMLSEQKRGALIAFPRAADLSIIKETGTYLNAELSSTLIRTIFDHDTPLHDGAVFIEGDRLTYAGCYLPLSEQAGIKATFGTRHRAALGLAEGSDAVVLVVSEETRAISVAYNASIMYDLDLPTLKNLLTELLIKKSTSDMPKEEALRREGQAKKEGQQNA